MRNSHRMTSVWAAPMVTPSLSCQIRDSRSRGHPSRLGPLLDHIALVVISLKCGNRPI